MKNAAIGALVTLVAVLGFALYRNSQQKTFMESAVDALTEVNAAIESDNGSIVDQTQELADAIAAEIKAASE